MKHTLPQLRYEFNALEPHLDAATMEIHYSKHHQTYCDKFNAVIEKYPALSEMSAEDIVKNLNSLKVEEFDRTAIKNFGGGFVNHNLWWSILGSSKELDNKLLAEIDSTFGSLEDFKKQFIDLATKHFGSGWTWLVRDENNNLKIYNLPNQDSPLTIGHTPILNLDLWEHAYYLKFQNRKTEFFTAFWNVMKLLP